MTSRQLQLGLAACCLHRGKDPVRKICALSQYSDMTMFDYLAIV